MKHGDLGQLVLRVQQIRDRVIRKGAKTDDAIEACDICLSVINKYHDLLVSNRTRLRLVTNLMDMKK